MIYRIRNMINMFRCRFFGCRFDRGYYVDWCSKATSGIHNAYEAKSAREAFDGLLKQEPVLIPRFKNWEAVFETKDVLVMIDADDFNNRLCSVKKGIE